MMPFFRDLRRKKTASKALRTQENSAGTDSNQTNGSKSSSTLDSVNNAGSTPASSLQLNHSSSNLSSLAVNKPNSAAPSLPQRPVPLSSVSNRSSFIGLNTPSINGTTHPTASLSPFAPKVTSISDQSWVHQKILLIYGHIGEPNERNIDGTITIYHHQDNFPATSWPVNASHFKALVHLTPGPNRLRLDFASPKVVAAQSSLPTHCSWIRINFLPLIDSPPLQLAIILGKDSSETFDVVPERKQREGNDLQLAIRKFRMSAYLWAAFTSEQMYRQGFGRRCFRFEEDWQHGTLSWRDRGTSTMRNEAKIHIIRSDRSVNEIRDLDIAQQSQAARRKDELFNIATEAVRNYFKPAQGQQLYVSALFLDSHWDTHSQIVTGHAALGGRSSDINLGIFGSHALQSYPASIEEVVPAFSDCTKTDTTFVANDCNDAGSNWESANLGIGAHLHETGHMLGCPHQEHGVMARDYTRFSRTFLTREPYCTRTKSPGVVLPSQSEECGWHRLDTLRFKYHPCFRMPTDTPVHPDDSIQIWPADNGKVIVTAASGIAFAEIFANEDHCKAWLEFGGADVQAGGPPRQVILAEDDIRNKLTHSRKAKNIKIKIFSAGLGEQVIDDFCQAIRSKDQAIKLPNGKNGFRSTSLGFSQLEGTRPQRVILDSAFVQTKLLTSIKVFHGLALDGLEFIYEDTSTQLFGNRGGRADEFMLDTRRGEILLGFYLRAGLWIDGIEILTSLGRRSGVFGKPNGGSGHSLVPPRGYSIAGIDGTCSKFVDGFSLIVMR